MGCVQGGRGIDEPPPNERDNRLSILVSLMLSSQTKDPVTFTAVANLRTVSPLSSLSSIRRFETDFDD